MKFLQPSFTITFAIAAWGNLPASAHPNPNEIFVARAVNCKAVTGVLGAIKALGAPATSFCSSYLKVPATSTVRATITPTQYATTTAPAVVTQVTDSSCPRIAAPGRRAVPELGVRGAPPALKAYAAGEISSACNCLSLKPKATTTIITTAAPVVATATVTPISTSTICAGCVAVGLPCEFEHPEYCCSQTCACISGNCNCYNLG